MIPFVKEIKKVLDRELNKQVEIVKTKSKKQDKKKDKKVSG